MPASTGRVFRLAPAPARLRDRPAASELDVDLRARERVREAQPSRVQKLALEAEIAGSPVDGIAADGQVDRLEVDADLVRAAGLEPDVEQSVMRASARAPRTT